MNAAIKLLAPSVGVTARVRFANLRFALAGQGIRSLRLVYAVLEGDCFITLTAVPSSEKQSLAALDRSLTSTLRKAFQRWMRHAHPDWQCGFDCTGVIDWDLDNGWLSHRHSGYELQWCRHVHGNPLG
jgi:hypothetical protein